MDQSSPVQLRGTEFTNRYSGCLGNSTPGFASVYVRATHAPLEAAVENLIEPIARGSSFEREAG
jgi:hypothetical protein